MILYKLNEMQSQLKKIDDVRVSHRGEADVGGTWEFTDTSGKKIDKTTFYNSYYLIYFGFTHCPDICPANLIKLRKTVANIRAQNPSIPLRILFISVDPERDSLREIRSYLDGYDSSIIGATSENEEQLKIALKSFKVVANKVFYEPEEEELKQLQEKFGDDKSKVYTMDHTTNTYLMGT